ncbi:MAG TPA: ABC transporter ATP-binding protein [Lachnospiraceae bacterium]|nr:ABC transporter ATP-binding protein [Lachnospiraceae bacterium]
MSKILQVNNITKYYGSGSVVTKALNGISFTIEKGDFTAIMGASGSGKSTLLNVISTIDRASSGDILIDETNLSDMTENRLSAFRRDKLGFIFQEYNLLDTLTVAENITLPLNLKKRSPSDTRKELERVADVLEIRSQLQKFPRELSGGQRQRAACARALITNPALILADEPTGALDSANSKVLMDTFTLMNANFGSTILMVTHDAMVGSYANRVLFLKDGKLWNELLKGNRGRQELHREILTVCTALGGDNHVQ